MKTTLLFSFLIALFLISNGQSSSWNKKNNLTIASYNIENLFDTINTPGKFDEEFTPGSDKKWNTERYQTKLNNLAKVISSINPYELPEIIGIVEAENKEVLIDLANTDALRSAKYEVILDEGPDARGIDCGLIYNPKDFKYLTHKTLTVRFPFAQNKRTRDILYVKGKVKKEEIHLFVNHWSSRRGGQEKSEPKRIESAKVLKHSVDSILKIDPDAKIVMMGDFNDEPSNKSIFEVLNAGNYKSDKLLVNTVFQYEAEKKGTYYFRGNYDQIDHIITSRGLINQKNGFRLLHANSFIHNPDFLCFTNKSGDKTPSRTYGGKNYYGGYSDHFAIYATFIIK